MKVDFHCHTTASDGTLSPLEIIDLALEHNVECLAITDHDTTAGYEAAMNYALQSGVQLIVGTEVSCQWQGHTIHIVGLDFDVTNKPFQAGLSDIRTLRWKRAHQIIEKLEQRPNFNVKNLLEKIQQRVGPGIVGRGHFAQILIEEGLVSNAGQAFDKYLKRGRVGYVKSAWPELKEVVGWITAAGGVAVIAHPKVYKFTSRKLNLLITDFKSAGGQGIEVVNQPRFSSDIIGMVERANTHGLYASVGSDFHCPKHKWRGLGWLAPLPEKSKPIWTLFETPIKEIKPESKS